MLIAHAAINFTVTPIKYELEMQPGESRTFTASIRNNGVETVTLPTTASDFQANGTDGTPSFVRKSELVFPDQQLSTWISIEEESLTLAPGEEKTTNFTIDVPTTATPGWHYGWVFFKNDNSEESTGWNISINVDYGIIILVNVSGEVIVDVEIEDPIIWGNGKAPTIDQCPAGDTSGSIFDGNCWDGTENPIVWVKENNWTTIPWYVWEDENGNAVYDLPDNCPWGDFTPSRYDDICIDLKYPISNKKDIVNNEENNSGISDDNFEVDFIFPINNKGNTHVKPEWKITLRDENGNIIKAVGKETVTNENWAVIWEKIVDYIPINDEWGNILPSTKRVFESQWKWFPYKSYDDEWNIIVNYWTPSEYYTNKNKQEAGFLMLWERVSEIRTHKTITAEIEMTWYDENGNPIDFTTAKDFPVQYIEEKVTLNPYIILALLLLATIILMTWFAIRWWIIGFKKRKCWNCKEKIKSHWETCPYCKAIQNKKKHKSFESLKEKVQSESNISVKSTIKKKTSDNKTWAKKRGRPPKKKD